MVDPSRCPIPPGFEVIGGFSDEFDHFRETTGYGPILPLDFREQGYSNRWKNPNIRSVNIVAGFQFKIGPHVGHRWQGLDGQLLKSLTSKDIGEADSGDIGLYFPRTDQVTGNRGSYVAQIKWVNENNPIAVNDAHGLVTFGKLDKEFPHPVYANTNYFVLHPEYRFRSLPNPQENPNLQLPQARDGQWHSFLAVIFNDYYLSAPGPTIGEPSPTIGLWYSHNPTFRFDEFTFLGMSIDKKPETIGGKCMFPGDPLILSIELSDGIFGNDIFEAEHALQIRIDDVPTEEVEIRNAYAANVRLSWGNTPTKPCTMHP